MTLTSLEVRCDQCRKVHTRQVSVIEPEAFSPTGSRSVMSQFWCPKCGQVNAIRYEFYRNNEGNILAKIKGRVQPVGMALMEGKEEEN